MTRSSLFPILAASSSPSAAGQPVGKRGVCRSLAGARPISNTAGFRSGRRLPLLRIAGQPARHGAIARCVGGQAHGHGQSGERTLQPVIVLSRVLRGHARPLTALVLAEAWRAYRGGPGLCVEVPPTVQSTTCRRARR